MFVTVQPIVYLVRESYAQVVCRTLLVEYHALPTTGTSEITTVVYGQSEMSDVTVTGPWERPATVGGTLVPEIGTLILVAVPVGLVRY